MNKFIPASFIIRTLAFPVEQRSSPSQLPLLQIMGLSLLLALFMLAGILAPIFRIHNACCVSTVFSLLLTDFLLLSKLPSYSVSSCSISQFSCSTVLPCNCTKLETKKPRHVDSYIRYYVYMLDYLFLLLTIRL